MKQFYSILFLILLVLSASAQSSEAGITNGELSVSLNGAANYTIPIAVPPGINGVVPQINLVYNSQTGNGSAGYGWNISGISAITYIQPSMFHDGVINSIDADLATNRFALDGQRLLKKDGGAYFAAVGRPGAGNEYVLENYSNVKISSFNQTGSPYSTAAFNVSYPDGSTAYYESQPNPLGNTNFTLRYWQNAQGVRITYTYNTANNKKTTIASIQYGSVNSNAPLNEIKFIYKSRTRPEQGYIDNYSLTDDTILSEIKVFGNGVGYRNYVLGHDQTLLGYDRLISITEKSGDNTKSYSPTVFEYEKSADAIEANPNQTATLGISNITSDNSSTISGDFDGDGKMDFLLYPTKGSDAKNKVWLFSNLRNASLNMPKEQSLGAFETIFPSSFLYDNGKMSPAQGITVLQRVDLQNIKINTYYNSTFGIGLLRSRTVNFPVRLLPSCVLNRPVPRIDYTYDKTYLSGDFNGDGITDMIAIDNEASSNTSQCESGAQPKYYSTGKVYFIDLDSRKTTGYFNEAGTLSDYVKNSPYQITYQTNDRFETFDVNGDGKTDILHFKFGSVTVYTLDSNNLLKLLWKTVDGNIITAQTILPGDYNGDGKMDFIISKNTGLTNSNDYFKFLSTGNGFEKTTQYYAFPNMGSSVINESGGGVSINSLIPLDYNGDGKTDMIHFRSIYGNTSKMGAIIIKSYNNTGTSFTSAFEANIPATTNIKSYAAPLFLSPNKNNQYVGIGAITDNLIYTFNSLKDTGKETSLSIVTSGNGVKDKITYSKLQQDPYETVYTPAPLTENYPNVDIQTAPNVKIVKMLERTSATDYKKQTFNYYGAVANSQGLGYLGFRATARTNWYSDTSKMISYISKNDINLRGANIENYAVQGFASANYTPGTTFISKSILGYNTPVEALQTNKVFKLKNISIKDYNGLTNTSKETALEHNILNYVVKSTESVKEGASEVQQTITDITYKDPATTPYLLGLVATKNQSVTVPGSSISTEQVYNYTTTGLLQELKKKNTGTNYVTEYNDYDTFGNLIQKTISATDVTPRVTKYQYDTSGRFLIKSIDVEKLETVFDYDPSTGKLNYEIDAFGFKTSYQYDKWLRRWKTIDYLGNTTTVTYTNSANKTVVSTIAENGNESEQTFDDLGRKIKDGTKDINGSFSYVSYLYDINDRNVQTSEPYFGAAPTYWNTIEYDILGRVITSSSYTGKTASTLYSGLTATISENGKSKSVTKNALGNIVSLTETPGGTITYTYYANGGLKSSTFDQAVTTIDQDSWGRKSKIVDPSAGTFSYAYNDLGEVTMESNSNGSTSYNLSPEGAVLSKTMSGINTNSKVTYTYDSTSKLLSNTKYEDFNEPGNTINTKYTYDYLKRISEVEETTPYAQFKKKTDYDTYGRPSVVTSTASSLTSGKSSTVAVKNSYKNGALHQVVDNADNSNVIWQTNSLNAKGEVATAVSGPFNVTNNFDTFGYPSQIKYDSSANPGTNILTLDTSFDPVKGNLMSRSNSLFSWNESLDYDVLDRLTKFNNEAGVQTSQDYDVKGRITTNRIGTYKYANADKPYLNSSINLSSEALAYYTNRPLLKVTYNIFKSPVEIEETGVDKINFTYNEANERSVMFYGSLQNKLLRPMRKHYSGDGTMEIKENRTLGTFEFITYIAGDAYSAPAVYKSDAGGQQFLFLLRDYQGSIVAITDKKGAVLEKRLFDAWGAVLKVQNGSGTALSGLTILDRGYTGHEHLQSVGIINMNGRIYDPKLHRFLQPDNNIQDPFNVQNHNRFGYVLNNPFKYTDPSGEFWNIVIGAAIGGVFNWASHGFQFNAKGLGYFAVGAASGALTAMGAGGVSSALAGGSFSAGALGTSAAMSVGSGFYSSGTVAAAGGLIGGFTSGLGNGLVDGQSFADSFKMGIRDGAIGTITAGLVGGAIGGFDALSQGRDFWSGAGQTIDYVKVPANTINSDNYSSTAEMRKDYNSTIGVKDNLTLNQVEKKLNTTVTLAGKDNLPTGWSLTDANAISNGRVNAAGLTINTYSGGPANKVASTVYIAPTVKGYDLTVRNMFFKHEFMHAWHIQKGFIKFNTFSERSTSTFSVAYLKTYGYNELISTYTDAIGYYPRYYSWRNFAKIIPLWIK